MSTINYNTKGRPSNRGRQSNSNSSHPSRSGASKRPPQERFLPEGVYSNSRFTHVIYSLVGCVVQVQVKNGCIYEGVFRTVSQEMNVVLELAHKVEDSRTSVPSRDRLIEKLIFGKDDVVSVSAVNVELDYAVKGEKATKPQFKKRKKDTFTDAAITRYNGQTFDREVRELQPWDSESGTEIGLLENDSSNGWDPNEMFKRNAEQFSVKSTYDENLSQYTIPLEKKDTKEYRQREEEAARLAKEIERSDDYQTRINLENGDGDEESKFSSVFRPSEGRGPGNGSGKYIPPHHRRGMSGIPPQRRGPDHGGQQRQISPNKPMMSTSPVTKDIPQLSQAAPTGGVSMPAKEDHIPTTVAINGEKEVKHEAVVNKSSPEPSSPARPSGGPAPAPTTPEAPEKQEGPPPYNSVTPPGKGIDRRGPSPRGRRFAELKEFGENFKLSEETGDKKTPEKVEDKPPEDEAKKEESKTNVVEGFKFNPMAREFVPSGQPKPQPQANQSQRPVPQTPTPPRPQNQSPVLQPIVPVPYGQYVFPGMMPVAAQQQTQAQGSRYPAKRAVVSVQPRADYTAAAQHVSGQPLLANASVPTQQYLPYSVMPGYQVMPVSANPQRMVNHNPVASSHPSAGMEHAQGNAQQTHAAQPIFMPPGHGPMPAHIAPHPGQQMSHPQPAHVGTHPVAGNHQSQGQMTPVSGPHPAPSPVQPTGPGVQQHHPQGHPTSGTPQPPMNYPQMGMPAHPQMQTASHNPASPQAVSMPYALTSHPHIQQGQFTYAQAPQQTSVSQTMHTHSQHMAQPQIVVMPQPQPHAQVQHAHHVQQHPQFQPNPHAVAAAVAAGHHMQGPTSMHGQAHAMIHHSGMPTLPVSNQSGVHPSSLHHFVSQVPSHGQGGSIQAGYPQAQ